MTENIIATWNISLNCDCPACDEYVDLMDDPDFWDGRAMECGEHETENSTDVTVYCPECGHEFTVDLEY